MLFIIECVVSVQTCDWVCDLCNINTVLFVCVGTIEAFHLSPVKMIFHKKKKKHASKYFLRVYVRVSRAKDIGFIHWY